MDFEGLWMSGLAGEEHDGIDLLLEEAERTLLDVDTRADTPFHRSPEGDLSVDHDVDGIAELRLLVAELHDAYPTLFYDLEAVLEKSNSRGRGVALHVLKDHPPLLDLARLSLEILFRRFPDYDAFHDRFQDVEDDSLCFLTSEEAYSTYHKLREGLRTRLQ